MEKYIIEACNSLKSKNFFIQINLYFLVLSLNGKLMSMNWHAIGKLVK